MGDSDLDVVSLIEKLNRALADEWLAYYQYWMGAKLATGAMKEKVVEELEEHAGDELRHAGMVADRIIQLGGTPILDPKAWHTAANCGYEVPEDPSTAKLLEQNIKGERCAIRVYKAIMEMTQNKDRTTFSMAEEIMQDEIEHEEDLKKIQADIGN